MRCCLIGSCLGVLRWCRVWHDVFEGCCGLRKVCWLLCFLLIWLPYRCHSVRVEYLGVSFHCFLFGGVVEIVVGKFVYWAGSLVVDCWCSTETNLLA